MPLQFKELLQKVTERLENEIIPRVELQNPLPESLTCCQCMGILRKPQQLSCGHRICLRCVPEFLAAAPVNEDGMKFCVDDGDEVEVETFPDNSAMKDIMQLPCFCLLKTEGCPWSGQMIEIEEHLGECEYNVTLQCKFKDFGCKFTGTGKKLEQHMKDDVIHHNAYTTLFVAHLEKQGQQNRLLATTMEKKANALKTTSAAVKEMIINLKKDIVETNDVIGHIDDDEIKDIHRRVETFMNKQESLEEKQKELSEKIEEVENLTKILNMSDKHDKSYDQQVNDMSKKLERLDLVHKQNQDQMKHVELKTKLFQSTTFDGTFIWKLDNLEKRYLDAVTGKTTELITAPLHTSRYGYKFCAKVLLNGNVKLGERSDHVAIYIIIMRGDFDDILTWPFRHIIKITLLNVADKKKDLEMILAPRLDLPHFQKPKRETNHAIGFPRFCSHEALYAQGFVKDDAVFIRIEVEKETV